MYDLNSLLVAGSGVSGLSLGYDRIINNSGQIAATGSYNGQYLALLLTPVNAVPVPAFMGPLLFLLMGVTGMLALRRRKPLVPEQF